jgi:hypothetical protein
MSQVTSGKRSPNDDAHGFLRAAVGGHLVGELGRERRVDTQLGELAQQPGAHGRFAVEVAPGQARELRLEQAA